MVSKAKYGNPSSNPFDTTFDEWAASVHKRLGLPTRQERLEAEALIKETQAAMVDDFASPEELFEGIDS